MIKPGILLFVFAFIMSNGAGQDTIFSYPYPNGIVTDKIESTPFTSTFSPIDNQDVVIVLAKDEIIRISFASGILITNKNYKAQKCQVLPTDKMTGKIIYSEVVEFPGISKKNLYNSLKHLPQSVIDYKLVAEDIEELTFQRFTGSFLAHFAGDPYTVFFNLEINFKDGRIRYTYTDFTAVFIKQKTKHLTLVEGFSSGSITSIPTFKVLDQFYAKDGRKTDKQTFWIPINNNINQSIKTICKIFADSGSNNEDW